MKQVAELLVDKFTSTKGVTRKYHCYDITILTELQCRSTLIQNRCDACVIWVLVCFYAYLYTIITACVWMNDCKPIGSKWFDKESCRGYSCVLDITDNDVKITERTVGKS